MSRFAKAAVLMLSLTGLGLWTGEAIAAAKYARTTGTWTTNGNWSSVSCAVAGPTTAPTAADDVTICPGVTITMDGNSGAAQSLAIDGTANWAQARTTNVGVGGITINAGGDITDTANGVLTSTGGLNINATLTSANVTVTLQTTAAQNITGTGSLARLTVTGAGVTATNTGTLTVRTALAGTGGLTNGATLNIGGTSTITTLTASASPNTVNYTGAAQTVHAATYHHLTLSGSGTKTVGAITLQANGTTTVTGTATLNISSTTGTKTFVGPVFVDANCSWTNTANEPVNFGGGITHNGTTFSAGTGLQTFDTNSQALAGTSAMSFGGAVTVTGAITLTNNNTNTVTITGTLNGTDAVNSTFTNGASATLNYGALAAPMVTGVLTASANLNTVNYNRAGAQTVRMPTGSAYHHLTLSGSLAKTMPAGAMTVGGGFTMSGAATATAAGAMTVNGNFTVGGGTTFNAGLLFAHGIKGYFSNSGTFTASTSTITLNGTAVQDVGGSTATTFNNLTINNSAGITLTTVNPTIGATLTLSSGNITAGSQTVIIATAGTVSRTSGHVIGNLQKNVATGGATSRTFEIGDANAYAPVTIAFANVSSAGNLIARTTSGEHPDIANSNIDANQNVNRYWTVTNSGVVFNNYSATLNYVPADIDSGADTSKFIIGKTDPAWSYPTMGTLTGTSAQASGMTVFSGFAVGQRKVSAANSTVVAVPTSVAADGTTTSAITVTLLNSLSNPVSGKLVTLAAGSGSSTITTVSGTTDANGQATFTVKDSVAESVTYTATDATDSITITQKETVSFVATVSSFDACEATSPQCTAGGARLFTKLVGVGFNLDLVALDSGGSIATSFTGGSGTVSSVDLIAYTAANPANMTGAVNRCPVNVASATINLGASVAFTSGRKTVAVSAFSSAYRDVRVRITYSGTSYCSTDKFSVRPQALGIGVTDSGGGAFPATLAAGANFGLAASGGTGYDGTPVSLNSLAAAEAVRTHDGATDYSGQLRQSGANTIAFPAAVSGVSNAMVQYHDVGSFEVLAQKVIDSSFTGVDTAGTDCVAGSASNADDDGNPNNGLRYGCNVANTASGLFGRFYPSYYTLASSTLAGVCGSSPNDFTYMGQSGLSAGYTLSAWSQANPASLKLTKYTAGYSYLATVSVVAANGTTATDLSSNLSPALTGTWSAGDYAVAVAARTYARPPTSPSGPYDSLNIAVGIADTDGAVLTPLDFQLGDPNCTVSCTHKKLGSAPTKVRYGVLKLDNAYGSELLNLRVPMRTLYLAAAPGQFMTNTLDSCTTVAAANVAFGNFKAPLASLTINGINQISAGQGSIVLTKPNVTGSADMAINLGATTTDASCNTSHPLTTAANLPWLRGNWCGSSYDKDPGARVRFGASKAPYIYLRERY